MNAYALGEETPQYVDDAALDEEDALALLPCAVDDGDDQQLPDSARVIVHIDVDCYYAQVETLRNPALVDKPMAVTQKYICVTSNYCARARGVGKLMAIAEAQQRCPELVLVNGEDLTPYRAMARRVLAIASRFGPTERLGMDELWVDVTILARQRVKAATAESPVSWHGWVHDPRTTGVDAPNVHRKMDVMAQGAEPMPMQSPPVTAADTLLAAGSGIAADIRSAMFSELNLRCSAGVAHNKLLSKLSSGLHKPNDQTSLPSALALMFLEPLPVRAIRGCGHTTERALARVGVSTVGHLRRLTQSELSHALATCAGGNRTALMLWHAARGRDSSPVVPVGLARGISVEDSFKGVSDFSSAASVLAVLAPDLAARLREEHAEQGRIAQTLTITWRFAQGGRHSASTALPSGTSQPHHADAIREAALSLLRSKVHPPFVLTLLNIGATRFSEGGQPRRGGQAASTAPISMAFGMMDGHAAAHLRRTYGQSLNGVAAVSKRQERLLREAPNQQPPVAPSADMPASVPPVVATETPASRIGLRRFFDATDDPAPVDGALCAECGRLIAPDDAVEHADWHFAQRLQREESSRSERVSGDARPSAKKQRVGPMDSFLRTS